MNDKIIRLTILAELARADDYALPLMQLHTQVNIRLRPPLELEALKAHLQWMLDRSMVELLVDKMDPENVDARRWYIREKGLTALNQ